MKNFLRPAALGAAIFIEACTPTATPRTPAMEITPNSHYDECPEEFVAALQLTGPTPRERLAEKKFCDYHAGTNGEWSKCNDNPDAYVAKKATTHLIDLPLIARKDLNDEWGDYELDLESFRLDYPHVRLEWAGTSNDIIAIEVGASRFEYDRDFDMRYLRLAMKTIEAFQRQVGQNPEWNVDMKSTFKVHGFHLIEFKGEVFPSLKGNTYLIDPWFGHEGDHTQLFWLRSDHGDKKVLQQAGTLGPDGRYTMSYKENILVIRRDATSPDAHNSSIISYPRPELAIVEDGHITFRKKHYTYATPWGGGIRTRFTSLPYKDTNYYIPSMHFTNPDTTKGYVWVTQEHPQGSSARPVTEREVPRYISVHMGGTKDPTSEIFATATLQNIYTEYSTGNVTCSIAR